MAPTPNTKASKAKIVKRARAQTGGLAALSNDDIVTIAIAIRNAEKMKVC